MKIVDSNGYSKVGKGRLPLKVYEQASLKKIAKLQQELDKLPRNNAEWTRVNKKRLAHLLRLNKRQSEELRNNKCQNMQRMA